MFSSYINLLLTRILIVRHWPNGMVYEKSGISTDSSTESTYRFRYIALSLSLSLWMCVCAYKRMCIWTFAYRLSRFCNTILSGALFLLLSIIIAQSPGVRQEDIVLRGVRVYLRTAPPSTTDEVMRASIRQWRFATVCDVNHGREWIHMYASRLLQNGWMNVCKWECVYTEISDISQ